MERVLQCNGCHQHSIRRESWHRVVVPDPEESEPLLLEQSYSPFRNWRRAPDWLDRIEAASPDLHGLLAEVYTATNDHQVRMLAMAVRAVVDVVMVQRLSGDFGSFEVKLAKMVDAGYLTKAQAETLETVIDAGSAAAHRGFLANRELLVEMVVIMESMIRELYISGPMMKALKQLIPPRPPRKH
jgi:hypothetical protein